MDTNFVFERDFEWTKDRRKESIYKMNNFKSEGQPKGILTVWNHFKKRGVDNFNFGMSKSKGEITIRTPRDTAYITKMVRNKTYRVTLYSSAHIKRDRKKQAKEYLKIEEAIDALEKALM